MEILIFAIVAARKGYITQYATFVREAAKFQPFDLRPLKLSYRSEEDSLSRTLTQRWVFC
jgi:hypothetical protein